jgi:diacylglycerol kinase family enzyme
LKARLGEYYYAWVATSTYSRRYLVNPPRFAAELGSGNGDAPTERLEGVTVLVQNASPYTFFGERSVEMAEGVSLHSGDLAGVILKRTSPLDIPSIAWRALSSHAKISGHRQIQSFTAEKGLRISSLDDRALPVHVDGDFIGSAAEHVFSVAPAALTILA